MQENGVDGIPVLQALADRDTAFALDIGTKADDLQPRQAAIEHAIAHLTDTKAADKVRDFIYFTAGIWPGVEDIHDRDNQMRILEECIKKAEEDSDQDTLHRKVIGIGECGLDHHWNPSGCDGRSEDDFDEKTYRGEKALFEAQLELARKLNLPVVIHSRDAFEDTVDCLKNVGYQNGIIHCYSYGLDEARVFLDMGWYIALGGSTTYTKKSKMEDMKALIRYIPEDRLLLETDSPYLAPVPFRGTKNTPVLIEETYKFLSEIRGITPEYLSNLVDENVQKLFFYK